MSDSFGDPSSKESDVESPSTRDRFVRGFHDHIVISSPPAETIIGNRTFKVSDIGETNMSAEEGERSALYDRVFVIASENALKSFAH